MSTSSASDGHQSRLHDDGGKYEKILDRMEDQKGDRVNELWAESSPARGCSMIVDNIVGGSSRVFCARRNGRFDVDVAKNFRAERARRFLTCVVKWRVQSYVDSTARPEC